MTSASTPNFLPALVVSVVAWRVYVRIRRNIGRQELRVWRLKLQMIFFSVAAVLMAVVTLNLGTTKVLAGLIGGLLAGVALGKFGLRLTRFEDTEDGFYYTPNTYLGVGLSLLLIGRLAYRFAVLHGMTQSIITPVKGFMQSPLTLFMFGLLAGYYTFYNAGVLQRSKAPAAAAQS